MRLLASALSSANYSHVLEVSGDFCAAADVGCNLGPRFVGFIISVSIGILDLSDWTCAFASLQKLSSRTHGRSTDTSRQFMDPANSTGLGGFDKLKADASLGSFVDLLREVQLDDTQPAGASSDEALCSNSSLYSDPAGAAVQPVFGTDQLARHAQQEAARFQLTESQRRVRNKAAQASFRQRKRVSRICVLTTPGLYVKYLQSLICV